MRSGSGENLTGVVTGGITIEGGGLRRLRRLNRKGLRGHSLFSLRGRKGEGDNQTGSRRGERSTLLAYGLAKAPVRW